MELDLCLSVTKVALEYYFKEKGSLMNG